MILRNLRKQIENIINQSGLPIDAIYFVLKDILNEVTEIYNNEIAKEEMKNISETTDEDNKENTKDKED